MVSNPIDPSQVVSGNFGKLYDADGRWLTNITTVNATAEYEKEQVSLAGSRWRGQKVIGINGTGSMSGYLVTSELIEYVAEGMSDNRPTQTTELIYEASDPDNGGTYRIRLKNVMFDSVQLIASEVGALVTNEFPFTFVDFQIMDRLRNA